MFARSFRLAPVVSFVLAATAPCTPAGDVYVVAPDGSGDFTTIQEAVDVTGGDDLVLVRPGAYSGFLMGADGGHVIGWPRTSVVVQGPVAVRGLAVDAGVTLADLGISGGVVEGSPRVALTLAACEGSVRIQNCSLRGGGGATVAGACEPGSEFADAASALVAIDCADVVVTRSALRGGKGMEPAAVLACDGRPGGIAVQVNQSRLALYDCEVVGGNGGTGELADGFGGTGGIGAAFFSGFLYAAGSSIHGGRGGRLGPLTTGTTGDGGDGLLLSASAEAVLLDVEVAGGASPAPIGGSLPGARGAAFIGDGVPELLPGRARRLALETVTPGPLARATVEGVPGDRVWLPAARRTGYLEFFQFLGVWHVPYPALMPVEEFGTIPGTGSLPLTTPVPALPIGEAGALAYLQVYVRDAADAPVVGEPAVLALIDCSILAPDCDSNGAFDACDLVAGADDCDADGRPDVCQPDCNANGLADTCDLSSGASQDVNGNGVPDECEPVAATWYVQAGAPPGGDGSLANPFDTIQEGVDVALAGAEIVLLDGMYRGPGNREVELSGRQVVLRSANGPANCVIDCEGDGRAFLVRNGDGRDTVLQRLTIRNGDASTSPVWAGIGGGIFITDSSPTILGCTIERCYAASTGGGVFALSSDAELNGCYIQTCRSIIGAGAVELVGEAPRLVRCNVIGNSGGSVGGVMTTGGVLVACRILGNTGDAENGGVRVFGRCRVDGCLIAGNQGVRGGGVAVVSSSGQCLIAGSTIVANHALEVGGGVRVDFAEVVIFNTILADNSAMQAGAPASVSGGSLRIEFSRLSASTPIHVDDQIPGEVVLGPGVVGGSPDFVDADGPDDDPATLLDNDYRLGLASVCVDAGDNGAVPADGTDLDGDGDTTEPVPLDLDNRPRFADEPAVADTGMGTAPIVDMGAYER